MKTRLSKQQIQHFRDHGYVTVKNFLSPEELEKWRSAVDQAVTGRGDLKIPSLEVRDAADTYYDNVFIQRVNLWRDNPGIAELVLDPRIGKIVCDLEDLAAVRIWHDQALIKAPWANPTAFHIDNAYWSFSSKQAVSIWVALDDATLQNGCLWFIPGTHKEATYDPVEIGPMMSGIFKMYPQWKSRRAVPIELKAGSCSFHNGLIAHGANANMTPGYRRAMTCIYMPNGSTFNGKQNILTKEQLATLRIGDPLQDDTNNPIVYARKRKTNKRQPAAA
jgi:phytanoyl-CoA hydroxylase